MCMWTLCNPTCQSRLPNIYTLHPNQPQNLQSNGIQFPARAQPLDCQIEAKDEHISKHNPIPFNPFLLTNETKKQNRNFQAALSIFHNFPFSGSRTIDSNMKKNWTMRCLTLFYLALMSTDSASSDIPVSVSYKIFVCSDRSSICHCAPF